MAIFLGANSMRFIFARYVKRTNDDEGEEGVGVGALIRTESNDYEI